MAAAIIIIIIIIVLVSRRQDAHTNAVLGDTPRPSCPHRDSILYIEANVCVRLSPDDEKPAYIVVHCSIHRTSNTL